MAAKTRKKELEFEEALQRLEEIVDKLEEGEVPLSQAVKLYEEGLRLSKVCLKQLNEAELRLKKITKNLDGSFTVEEYGDGDQ